MSVTFLPHIPIGALENYIKKKEDGSPLDGEIYVYKTLFNQFNELDDDVYIWHDLKLATHSDTHNPYKKNESQIDFLVVMKQGVCVIEVKGGQVEFVNGEFNFRHNGSISPFKQNPLKQVEGYKYTLKDKVLQIVSKHLFIDICVFPFTQIDFSINKNLFGDIIYTKIQEDRGIKLIDFIFSRFKSVATKIQEKRNFIFPKLTEKDLSHIRKILAPNLLDLNPFVNSSDTFKWLGLNNFEIFEGLIKNQRILIEGVPGCGKTTFALAFADQKRHLKGLYLCWNRLLKVQVEFLLNSRKISNLHVNTYYSFLNNLGLKSLSVEDSSREFRLKVVDYLRNFPLPEQYDYIIIDEGQDVINKGVDTLIDSLTASGQGLKNGNVLFLCDNEQAYTLSDENISDDIDLLSLYFSHFQMNQVHRSINNPQIRNLALKALEDISIFDSDEIIAQFQETPIKKFPTFQRAKNQMIKDFLKPIRDINNSLRGKDCVLLVESSLLTKENIEELNIADVEIMSDKNVMDNANVLRYTTPLKYKGLEKENVALIVKKNSAINQNEIYVGVTRAKRNLIIYIVYE
jgi:hypothetical protein